MKNNFIEPVILAIVSIFIYYWPDIQEIITPEIYTSDPTGIGKGIFYLIFYGISLILSIVSLMLGIATWKESRNVTRFLFLLPLLFWILIPSGLFKNKDDFRFYLTSNNFVTSDEGATAGYLMSFKGNKLAKMQMFEGINHDKNSISNVGYTSFPKGDIAAFWVHADNKKNSKYYYLYKNNEKLKKPKKIRTHNYFNILISFGPLAISENSANEEVKNNSVKYMYKEKQYDNFFDSEEKSDDKSLNQNNGEIYYKCGNPDTLYYIILSYGKDKNATDVVKNGELYQYKDAGIMSDGKNYYNTFNNIPFEKYHAIKGIEITEKQFAYLHKKYLNDSEMYLDENAPDLTEKQLAYIKQNHPKSLDKN